VDDRKQVQYQPHSQGLSSSHPLERERETLVWSGHVSLGQFRTLGRGPLISRLLSRCFCQNQSEALAHSHARCFITISNSCYSTINLKAKQVKCLEAIYSGRDVGAVLPMGYGKSMIFRLLPVLLQSLHDKMSGQSPSSSQGRPVVIVVSPLNTLTKDQIRKI
jgi:hypothetical protein